MPRGTPASDFPPARGNPQGEKRRDSSPSRSIRSTASSFAYIQLRTAVGSRLGALPISKSDFSRLKASSTCHLTRYNSRICSGVRPSSPGVARTYTYSASSSVAGETVFPFLRAVFSRRSPAVPQSCFSEQHRGGQRTLARLPRIGPATRLVPASSTSASSTAGRALLRPLSTGGSCWS